MTKAPENRFHEYLSAGQPAFGVWVASSDPVSAEIIGRSGFDCALLDAQHGGVNQANLVSLLQAMELGGTPSLVRVGGVDAAQIMRALDLGAAGVVVPMVSNVEEARVAASAMRYPPQGTRSFGQLRGSGYYTASSAGPDPLCFAMIETQAGINNLDEIAAVPGIDGLFVGPVDLALAIGLGPVLIAAACKKHGKVCASASLGIGHARSLLDAGVQLVLQGSDMGFVRMAAAGVVSQLNEIRKELT